MKKIYFLIIIQLLVIKISAQTDLPSTQLIFAGFEDEEFITAPSVSFDGNYLIFVVIKDERYKFYEAQLINNQWITPIELTDFNIYLGEKTYKNSPVYNYNASKIYFEADTTGNKDIFVSERTIDGWTKPVALPYPINTNINEAEPSISADDNTIFFVRFENTKAPDCGTIYFSKKNIKHQWDTVKALINPINLSSERSPRILSDNKTLIFASKRDKNKDFKLYYAKNLDADVWLLPKPIRIFSKQDELFPSTDYLGKTIYFASANKDKKSQIFSADLPKTFAPDSMKILTGALLDSNNNPVKGSIDLLNSYSMQSVAKFDNNVNGFYTIFMPPNSDFLIDYSGINMSHKFINYNNSNLTNTIDTLNAVLFDSVNLLLKVYDKDIYEPINVDIKVTNKNTSQEIFIKKNKISDGRFLLTIPIGKKYTVTLTNPYIQPYLIDFDLSGFVFYNEFEKNIEIESQKIAYTFKILDNENNAAVPCDIILTNLSTNQKITSTATTDNNGNATIFVRKGDYYDVTINPQGYAFYNTQISINDNTSKIIDVKLQPLRQDVMIKLNNITFETNSADLNVESYQELDKVVDLLNNNPEIKVEISAHTDDIGSSDYNLLLSEKRAKSVVDYLISHEISVNRLIFKGYGETKPLAANNSDDNRALNRRVELKIIEVD
ncbi:MAG: OmpA family protein [Bacteroidales bacterium]|nr:OmpA family protein [Bacteroidales bacterium]